MAVTHTHTHIHTHHITVKREPPEFVYRDYHDNQIADDQSVTDSVTTASGRKTRNSNGSRLVSSRPGLRSGKNYSKSESEEDGQSCDHVIPCVGHVIPCVGHVIPCVGHVIPRVGHAIPRVGHV